MTLPALRASTASSVWAPVAGRTTPNSVSTPASHFSKLQAIFSSTQRLNLLLCTVGTKPNLRTPKQKRRRRRRKQLSWNMFVFFYIFVSLKRERETDWRWWEIKEQKLWRLREEEGSKGEASRGSVAATLAGMFITRRLSCVNWWLVNDDDQKPICITVGWLFSSLKGQVTQIVP